MPLTKLDEKAALILIDLQKGIVEMALATGGAEVVERAANLAQAFRQRGLPVVLVNVNDPVPKRTDAPRPAMKPAADWAELVAELNQQPSDILVTKHSFGAFIGTGLDEVLRARGVTQVFIAGISTSVGVESTARSAFDYGYNVVLVSDAMTDRDPEAHKYAVGKIFPRLAEVDTTDNVLQKLRG
jgi:nicotinamidase-related amidase